MTEEPTLFSTFIGMVGFFTLLGLAFFVVKQLFTTLKPMIKCIGCFIRLGSILEHIIGLVTLGHGKTVAYKVARWLGYSNCGCDSRRIWLNQLTCKSYSETISII